MGVDSAVGFGCSLCNVLCVGEMFVQSNTEVCHASRSTRIVGLNGFPGCLL